MTSIVVVDDEYIVVEGIKALLKKSGGAYDVVGFAYDGIAALKVILATRPDVVITDIRIPGLDGLSLIEEARETLPGTAFIVISGYTEFEYARRALSLGVKGYIDKPITLEKLLDVLGRIEQERAKRTPPAAAVDMEPVISAITRGDGDALAAGARTALEGILKLPDANARRDETFKFLCVATGVYFEQSRQRETEQFFAHQELSALDGQALYDYAMGAVSRLGEKLRAERSGSSRRIILKLLEYINEHYQDDIGLNELADMVSLSPAYLSMLFKEEVGMSYVKYLTALRVAKAKELLLAGNKVTEVSALVGYSNYRYFCDIFKRKEGVTPNEYKSGTRR